MIRASVIGWPISHSRSPLIHNHWLKLHNIEGFYDKQAIEPQHLADFVAGLRSGDRVGTNVTIPHKENALLHVDEPDDRVRRIGALNTIWRENGKLLATSTDGPGFLANVNNTLPGFDLTNAPVTILGAGGSARSLIDELLRQNVTRIFVYNRTRARAENLERHFGPSVQVIDANELSACLTVTGLLINTIPGGLTSAGDTQIPWAQLHKSAVVADIVYTPLVTPFLQCARQRGHAIVPGLGMLLQQAVVGFEKWFGVRPQVTTDLHDLVAKDIDPGYTP